MTKWMKMLAALLLCAAATPAHAEPGHIDEAAEKAAILKVVADMEAAWNRSDFTGYMAGFLNPGMIFVSGGKIQDGWQGTLDHYVRDYGGSPERRGTVHFYDISIDMLAPDAALLISHYRLTRPERAQQGINTRLFRKVGGRWFIAMNHVSSYDPAAAPAAK